MLSESQQKPKPRRQHTSHRKKTGKRCPNRNRKKEENKTKINKQQELKKEDSTQGEYVRTSMRHIQDSHDRAAAVFTVSWYHT